MLDQRRTARTGMIQDARIMLKDVILHCAALDLSSTGARVCFFIPFVGPEQMTLRLPDGQVRAARRRWQQGSQIGVEFLADASP